MDQLARDTLIKTLGTLHVANAELSAANMTLLKTNAALSAELEALKAQILRKAEG